MGDLEPRPSEPSPALRIGDAERERASEVLRNAAGDGRITLEELDTRLDATYAATTAAELAKVTADLGTRTPAPVDRHEQSLSAVFGGLDRTGRWWVPEHLSVRTFFAGAQLDLRQAEFAAPEVVIEVHARFGGVEILVSPQTRVIVEGHAVLGSFGAPGGNAAAQLTEPAQVVRVTGRAFVAGVTIFRKELRSDRAR